MADIEISNQGSIFLFLPITAAGREWIDENVQEDAQFFGNALAVEHRFAGDLAEGMAADGLILA
jgi:hypothetical protein